jgi:hypothetical protein
VVNFDDHGRVVKKFVHRLVLEAFIGPCPPGMEACHYPDPSRQNNHVGNLRWDTKQENAHDRYRDRLPRTGKRCSQCAMWVPCGDFYADTRAGDGLQSACKSCHNRQNVLTRDVQKKRRVTRAYMRRIRAQTPQRWR